MKDLQPASGKVTTAISGGGGGNISNGFTGV